MEDYKKKYEDALENFKKIKAANKDNKELVNFIEYKYPELKESEDERIRKEIIQSIQDNMCIIHKDKCIAWLEKQGEQNNKHLYDVIIALWDLLDKIDTFSDLQIDDINPDNPFKKIEYMAQERHKFVKSDGYNLYIKGEQITDFKQDEQKPTDKVEPKFKVGDTIVEKDPDEYDYETIKDIKDGQYTRTDAFIEKALKWYCLDCACNDNCAANHKCAFWSFFKDYLEGNDKALPPKISNAFNPDGSTTENYRYRHIIERIQDDFIEKACKFLYKYNKKQVQKPSPKATLGYSGHTINVDEFRNYMKGE